MVSERPNNVSWSGDAIRLELRPSGCMRVGGAILLFVWLGVWVLVEGFSVNFLLALGGLDLRVPAGFPMPPMRLDDAPAVLTIFVALWVFFWTWIGARSVGQLLLLLFGSDTVEIAPSHWSRKRSYGLFELTQRFERGDEWHASIERKTGALIARRARQRISISTLGTPAERQWVANEITRFFGGPPPPTGALPIGFVTTETPEGLRIAENRRGAVGCAMFALLAGPGAWLFWFRYARAHGIDLGEGTVVSAVFASGALLLALWALFARQYWIVAKDRLTEHLTFPGFHRRWEFRGSWLDMEMRTDSDGDEHFELFVRDAAGKRRRVRHAMNDHEETLAFGKFLEKQTGWHLEIAKGIVSS